MSLAKTLRDRLRAGPMMAECGYRQRRVVRQLSAISSLSLRPDGASGRVHLPDRDCGSVDVKCAVLRVRRGRQQIECGSEDG